MYFLRETEFSQHLRLILKEIIAICKGKNASMIFQSGKTALKSGFCKIRKSVRKKHKLYKTQIWRRM